MKNILIVDDASLIRFRLTGILESEEYQVFEAASANSVRQNSFSKDISLAKIDIILLDIYLKNENGLELLSFLTENHPKIPVIMVSGVNKASIIKKAVSLGAKDFIAKPFDKATVLSKINNLSLSDKNTAFSKKKEAYKANLNIELNRSLRSKLPFSVVKFDLPQKLTEKNYIQIKNFITSKIRNIDQVYILSDYKYLFILPLTDKSGSKVFIEKITSMTLDGNKIINKKFIAEIVVFPEDIIGEKELKETKHKEYRKEILVELGLD